MVFTKQIVLNLLLSLIFFVGYGRDLKITGRVVDHDTDEAVPFATIAFYEQENQVPLDGTTTDLDGYFTLNVTFNESHYLGISFIGYEDTELPLTVGYDADAVDIGRIQLRPLALELEGVEVAAMARTAVNRLDRVSYRAEDFETARGGTAADLLSRLPALYVSPEGEVSVRGTTDFVVYLNGRPTQIEPDVLLAQISASSVESVDIITVPSAAYDAQGKGGIINITTKRSDQRGLSVSANAKLGGSPWGNTTDVLTGDHLDDNRYGGGLNLMYANNGWMLYGGLTYDYRNLHGSRTGTGRILDPQTGNYKIMDAEGLKPEWHENITANLGFDHQLSQQSNLAGSYYFGKRLEGRTANYLYNNYFTDTPTLGMSTTKWDEDYTLNPNTGLRNGLFNTINLDYGYRSGDSGTLNVSGLYEYTVLSHDIDNPNISYDPVTGSLTDKISHYIQSDETPLSGYRMSVDYSRLLDNGLTLSMGVQPQFVVISGNFNYDTLNVGSGQWGAYTSLENSSSLRRGIYAAYIDGAGQWNALQYKVGLRAEHTNQGLEIDNPDYFNLFERQVQDEYLVQQTDLFPSLHASYTLNESSSLGLAASRRISRAPVKNMFPFLYRRHLEVYLVGDPALKPEYIQTLELSYKQNIRNQQFNLTGFYRGVDNAVFRVNTVFPEELVLIRSFTNAGETSAVGVELGSNLELGNRAKLFVGASLYQFHVKADIFGYREEHRSTNWNLKGSGNVLLGSQFRLSADFDVRSAEVTAQGRNEMFYLVNAALSYTPPRQNAWAFNLRVLNIFDTSNRELSTRAYDMQGVQIFYQDTDFYYYGPIAELMVTFNLNRISRSRPEDRRGFGGDEF
jgi:outer membrane receptor protein involved in Fe transport